MREVSSLADTRTTFVSYALSAADIPRLTILPNISTFLVNVDEFSQGLDDVNVLARPGHHQFRALVQTVIENFEGLKDVSPIFALVVQALVEHVHNLVEIAGTRRRLAKLRSAGGELTC